MSWQAIGDQSERTARKSHRCVWCAELVIKGERCVHQFGKYCGEFQSNYYHIECYQALTDAAKRDEYLAMDGFEAGSYQRGSTEGR